MLHGNYYVELEKYNKLVNRKNVKSAIYNGIYDRYEYPVLTRDQSLFHGAARCECSHEFRSD